MPIKYIPYFPEPIEGQAILDNFTRTLRYKGAYDVAEKLRRGMPYYEVEKQETVGKNADGNLIIRGECISACAYLREKGIKVDLVYIDPPFASGADYAKKVYIRRNPKVAEAIAKAEEELDIDELKAFEEKMYGDVWDKEKYLNWMYENLVAIKSVMSDTASIYVHLDWHIGHAGGRIYRSKPSILYQSNSPHIKSEMRPASSFVNPWMSGSQIAVQKADSMTCISFSEMSVFVRPRLCASL